jgi:putative glutamine amidotransferase
MPGRLATSNMKPRILIPGPPDKADYFEPYLDAVRGAGGDPALDLPGAPERSDEGALRAFLAAFRGVLFPGGADIEPWRYGQAPRAELGPIDPELDEGQFAVARYVLAGGLPALAVCRGLQVMAVAAGGALYQDIPSQRPSALRHSIPHPKDFLAHRVFVAEDSRLAALSGALDFEVNSRHHQAVRGDAEYPGRVGALVVTARVRDGLIEGLELPSHPFLVAVQWHPENLVTSSEDAAARPARSLLRGFVEACRR